MVGSVRLSGLDSTRLYSMGSIGWAGLNAIGSGSIVPDSIPESVGTEFDCWIGFQMRY